MDWKRRIRSELGHAGASPDDDVVEELSQHASAMYEAARADGESPQAAASRVERQVAIWAADAAALTRRPRRAPAVPPPPSQPSRSGGVLQDARYALRLWRRAPASGLVSLLTMALGIGTTTALFSLTWGVLMKPLPWPHADRVIVVKETRGGNPPRFNSFTNTAFFAWREKAETVHAIAAWSQRTMTLSGAGEPERLRVTAASASLFPVLGARPLIGSLFGPDDELSRLVVLSENLWRQRFGGDPHVLGRVLRLDGEPYTVVGVLPDGLAYPNRQARAWVPFRVPPPDGNELSIFDAVALLREGATPAHAAAEATARGRLAVDTGLTTTAIFGSTGPIEVSATPLGDALTRDVRQPLIILLAAVVLLLATATANVTSLQLARATARRREMAIRAAIGAGAGRLARQLLVENVLLGLGGGLAGLVLAWLLHRAIPALLPADFPRVDEIGVTVAVVSFAMAVSVLTSVIFGLLPALGVSRLSLAATLAEGGTAPAGWSGGARTARTRAVITGAQVAIACVLLVGASLLGRSFIALLHADRGYDPSNVLTARLALPAARYSPERRYVVLDEVLNRLADMPAVVDAAFTSELPLTPGGSTAAFVLRSAANLDRGFVSVQASPRIVSPRSFSALGLRIIEGRGFSEADTDTSPSVAVVNRTFSRRYAGGAALGAKLPMGAGYGMERVEATVVGIVDDVRYPGVAATESAHPEVYYSFRQMNRQLPVPTVTVLVRTHGDPRAAVRGLRSALREADADLAPDVIATMADRVLTSLARPRLYAVLVGSFAVFAIVIAAVGLFGVLSYSVAQRSRELGVRTALGASPSDIVRLVVGEGLVVTGAGLMAGLGAALALVRWLHAFLYGVTPYDSWTFAGVPLLILAVAVTACFVPARRASRVDPLKVLRAG